MRSNRWNDSAGWADRRRLRARFLAALFLSVTVHALVSANGAGGGAKRAPTNVPVVSSSLRVELALPEVHEPAASPPSEVLVPDIPVPLRQSRTIPSKRNVPSSAAIDDEKVSAPAGIADPVYYATRQLDVFPSVLSGLDLRYPHPASAPDATGRVLLLAMINAAGAVDEVNVIEAEPNGLFDEYARRALLAARFSPALKDGRPVKARVLVELNYASEQAQR